MTEEQPPAPKRIGKFEILRLLAKGGMGQVWLARNPDTDQLVAIKETLLADPGLEKRLDREAKILAQLEHPYILPIYDEIREGNRVYLVTRYVSGGTLADCIEKDQAPSEEQVLRWTDQILDALEAAHDKGILHRDIKPTNIFLSDKGDVLVGDFGLARDLDATMSLGIAGTVPFMSPEQLRGESLDGRSDLFSLGASLYQLGTGELPYLGASRENPPPSLAKMRPDLAPAFTGLVDAMLEPEPVRRPDSATIAREILSGARSSRNPPRSARPSLPRIAAVVLLLVLGAWGGPRLVELLRPSADCTPLGPTASGQRRLAILPFGHVGGEAAAELAEQLRRQLLQRLEGTGDLVVVPEESLACFIDSWDAQSSNSDRLEAISSQIGAEFTITGSVSLTGERMQAQLLLSDASIGEAIRIEGQIEDREQALDYGERLAVLCIPQLFRGPPHELIRAAATVSDDWATLWLYINGEQARKRQAWEPWKENFEACIEQDSTLALAHYGLAELSLWWADEVGARRYSAAALRHSAGLPPKIQDLIRARDLELRLEVDAAARLYATIISKDRDCAEAWYSLSSFRYHHNPYMGHSMEESREAFERTMQLDPECVLPSIFLRFVYSCDGDYAALDSMFNMWSDNRPSSVMRGILAYMRDDPQQQAVYADSMSLGALGYFQPMVLIFPDNQPNIERFLDAVLERVEPGIQRGWVNETQAHNLISMGRWSEALEHFDMMPGMLRPWRLVYESIAMAMPFTLATDEELAAQIAIMGAWRAQDEPYLVDPDAEGLIEMRYAPDLGLYPHMKAYALGLLHCRSGNLAQAKEELKKLRALPAPPGKRPICDEFQRTIEAWIGYLEEGPERSLEILEPAMMAHVQGQFYSGVQERGPQRWLRALCLEEVGRSEEALSWYAGLGQRTERQLLYVADAHFRRAKILEGLGRWDEARTQYEVFARLYDHSDGRYASIVQEAEASRARLANKN